MKLWYDCQLATEAMRNIQCHYVECAKFILIAFIFEEAVTIKLSAYKKKLESFWERNYCLTEVFCVKVNN